MSVSHADEGHFQRSVDRVYEALERGGFRPSRRSTDFKASCPMPSHDDPGPSLHVTYDRAGGKVKVWCFGCNAAGEDLAEAMGLTLSDLFDAPLEKPRQAERIGRSPRQRTNGARRGHLGRLPARLVTEVAAVVPDAEEVHDWTETAVYDYLDAGGASVQRVTRLQCQAEGHQHKEFRQSYVNDAGNWVKTKPTGFTPVLYRLPEVLAAVSAGRRVLLVEGEKDAETAEQLGEVATTNPGGGRNFPPHMAEVFAGAVVDVVLDRDNTGWARGVTTHALLNAAGAQVRLLLPAVTTPKADLTDHVQAGHDLDELVEVQRAEVEAWSRLKVVSEQLHQVLICQDEVDAQLAAAESSGGSAAAEHRKFAARWALESERRWEKLADSVDVVLRHAAAANTAWAGEAAVSAESARRQASMAARAAHESAGTPVPEYLQRPNSSAAPSTAPSAPPSATPSGGGRRNGQVIDGPWGGGDGENNKSGNGSGGGGRTVRGAVIHGPRYELINGEIVQVKSELRDKGKADEHWVETYSRVLNLDVELESMQYIDDEDDDGDTLELLGRDSRAGQTTVARERTATHVVFAYTDPATGERMRIRVEKDRAVDSKWLENLPVAGLQYISKSSGRSTVWDAIRQLSLNTTAVTLYRSTGWRHLPEHGWSYIHAGGALTAKGNVAVPVMLSSTLARYDMPDPTDDAARLRAAFLDHSAAMMGHLPERIAVMLLGGAYRAALSPNPWGTLLVGSPGSYKTGIAALVMQHFGEGWDRRRPGTSMSGNGDTVNARRIKLHQAKDALFFADDVAPTRDFLGAQRSLEELGRMVHNSESKERSSRDGQETHPGTPPRCSLLVTSEIMPRTGSAAERLVPVPLRRNDIALESIIGLDGYDSRYSRALLTSSFISWLARDLPGHREHAAETAERYAAEQRLHGRSDRQADSFAQFWTGWVLMTDFLVNVEALGALERDQMLDRVRDALQQAIGATVDPDMPLTMGSKVREMLAYALRTGLAYVQDVRTGDAPPWPLASRLGWRRVPTGMTDPVTGMPKFKEEYRGLPLGYVNTEPRAEDGPPQLMCSSDVLEAVLKAAGATLADAPQLDRATAIRALYDDGLLLAQERKGTTTRYSLTRTIHCLQADVYSPAPRRRVYVLPLEGILGSDTEADDSDGDGQGPGHDDNPTPPSGGSPDVGAPMPGAGGSDLEGDRVVEPAALTFDLTTQEAELMPAEFADAAGNLVQCRGGEQARCRVCDKDCVLWFGDEPVHLMCWQTSTPAQRAATTTVGQPAEDPATTSAAPSGVGGAAPQGAELAAEVLAPEVAPRQEATEQSQPTVSTPFRATAAVLHTDGVWLPDGTMLPLPQPCTHLGHLAQLVDELNLGTQVNAYRAEPGQVWLTAEAGAMFGLPTDLPDDPDERKEALSQQTAKLPFVTGAAAEGWVLGGKRPGLAGWNRVWREGSTSKAALIAYTAAMEADLKLFTGKPSPAALARRLQLFADAMGTSWHIAPAATGFDLLYTLRYLKREEMLTPIAVIKPAQMSMCEPELNWCRVPSDEEKQHLYAHAYDRGGSYLAAMASLDIGLGSPEHHPESIPFDPKIYGHWKVEVPDSGDWRMPHPLNPRGETVRGPRWFTTPTLAYAAELGYQITVVEAYIWTKKARVFDPLVDRFRAARVALDIDDEDAQAAYGMQKSIYTRMVGMMNSAEHMGPKKAEGDTPEQPAKMGYAPDRRHHIIGKHRTNVLRRIVQIGNDTDRWPVAAWTDAMLYLSNDPDPVSAWPGKPANFGRGLGQFKPIGSVVLEGHLQYLTGAKYTGDEFIIDPPDWAAGAR